MTERWLVATTEYAGVTSYTGGIGRHYAALLPALAAQGVGIDLVVFSDGPVAARVAPGIRRLIVVPTEGMPPAAALVHRARAVRRVFRSRAYDRVFLPEWMGLGSLLPSDAPLVTNLATGVRLAHEISGLRLVDLPARSRPAVVLQAVLEARQVRRSVGIVAISHAMAARAPQIWNRMPPVEVVRNCVDVAAVRRAAAVSGPPADWPESYGPTVLFLGRIERRKGVLDGVDAFARIAPRHPAARLALAGAGGDDRFEPSRAALLERVPSAARDRVTFLGHVAGEELYGAIAAADVVMCPSRWEGFGNVAVEVKAVGTPLIVTGGSGFDDFCADGDDSLVVPPADPDALAVALSHVIEDPHAARRRAARAAAAVDRFAPAPVADDLRAAVGRLLSRAVVAA
ncbi:glycosyltransferase family 4 protein [Microbacterium sp. KSW4-11]|uniref:Glycosyltransferase family 4 protein n=1 Tax=Microbacterium gawkjiense TaxID=3067309 RepID=A0ABU3G7Q8_9MICO|nr:glycosyltransferase family 4 protein [Microbacterium sp. KSW4-11]MDT3315848.1 glycosyltransferase family 4 protein [Microbacterium sp. KSW4-11]